MHMHHSPLLFIDRHGSFILCDLTTTSTYELDSLLRAACLTKHKYTVHPPLLNYTKKGDTDQPLSDPVRDASVAANGLR